MSKDHMPQRVFEVGAATVAGLHLLTGFPISAIAKRIADGYEGHYTDDGFKDDWEIAASTALEMLEDAGVPSPETLLRHFRYYVDHYDKDGQRRKKKKVFEGTMFTKEERNPNRKQEFLDRLKAYQAEYLRGTAPVAPTDSWEDAGG